MLSEPLPYHLKIRDYFKARSGIWSFFSAARGKEEQLASGNPLLYEKINIIRERMGLPPGEVHLAFREEILQQLNEQELSAFIARELAHIKFYSPLEGELETTDRIITALAGNPDSSATHYETVRRFRLCKEIYCDREAYRIIGEEGPVITMLSKLAKGRSPAQVEVRTKVLRLWIEREGQGESPAGTEHLIGTEPSTEMEPSAGTEHRARTDKDAEAAITQMVEGVMELDHLDVLAQAALSGMTRELLIYYLRPDWFRTPVVRTLARQYFPDLEVGTGTAGGPDQPKENETGFPDKLKTFLTDAHPSIREYFAYVLLDLALADPDLKDLPLGHAREVAETLGLTSVLEPIIKKEMTYSNDAH